VNYFLIARVTGLLLMLFSMTMITPLPFAWVFGEDPSTFVIAFLCTFVTGGALWLFHAQRISGRNRFGEDDGLQGELRNRDGFVITVLFYLGLGLYGALPLYLSGVAPDFTDAAFESLSGLTTTGATVLTGLDELPRSLLFYRQQLQWLGGMGIIVLAVAVLPMLGVGGMQLYRAETPGPVKDSKLKPRITETAKALWYVYAGLTIACALAYALAGMGWFDALCHSFATVAIGGFSTHDASLGYFDSAAIEAVCILFMFLAGINFGLHYMAIHRWDPLLYFRDPEVRFYGGFMLLISVLVVGLLVRFDVLAPVDALRAGVFQAVSVMTTTGFTTENFAAWPSLLPFLVFQTAFIGGCAGSTAGGMKAIRVLLICLQGLREIKRLIHPSAVIPVKLGREVVPNRVIESVWGFFSVYVFVFLVMVMALQATGLDFVSAFSAVGACLNNLGPGLGEVALNYAGVDALGKWILCAAMLLGRLEIFTLLVILSPAFWRS
jgi:trk system potassium uptake protein TrkH